MSYIENSQKNLPSQKIHNYSKNFEKGKASNMERLFIFCLNLFVTTIAYLIVPTIFCFCRKKFTLSKIKLIVIVNGICVWLIFMIIRINAG